MIRYRLTDGTLVDVDPAFEQIFLASNPGAVIATEEVAEEEIVSPDEISESTRLMENYRLDNESDEDLYKRITPISSTITNNYKVAFPGGYQEQTIETPVSTIDGISKTKNGKY